MKKKDNFVYSIFSYNSATPKELYKSKRKAEQWIEKETAKIGSYKDEFKIIKVKVV